MLIDAHCHFFTKNVLSQSVSNIEKMVARIDKLSKIIDTDKKNLVNPSILGLSVMDFFKMGVDKSVLQMYEHMRESYDQDFIAVPLMLDLSFASSNPESDPTKQKRRLTEVIKNKKDELVDKSLKISNVVSSLEERYHAFERSVTGADMFNDSYKNQIDDLTAIKYKMPDRVFPFFSIDPRRDGEFDHGVLGEIKKYIGKDKPFTGLKLYSSLGYSPTDPVLYDDSNGECVYSYCQKNKIPITIHSSIEGFANLMDKNHVVGDIYYPPAGRPVPAQEVFDDGIVVYKKSMRSIYFNDATGERLLTLNHPMLWRKVLEKYPKLILNMAHFGGVIQAYQYAQGKQIAFWPQYIKEIMLDFPKVYTDLSCYYDSNNNNKYLNDFYENVYRKLPATVKRRVMYGSDYYMISLYRVELKEYYRIFKDAFGKDFYNISEVNPRRFLKL